MENEVIVLKIKGYAGLTGFDMDKMAHLQTIGGISF